MSVIANGQVSDLWAAMADGIGELTFLSAEWVDAAREVLNKLAAERADGLSGVKFSFCEVAHNPRAYLRVGGKLAWHVTFDGGSVTVSEGEIEASDCDFKLQGEHAILSNMARLQYKDVTRRLLLLLRRDWANSVDGSLTVKVLRAPFWVRCFATFMTQWREGPCPGLRL